MGSHAACILNHEYVSQYGSNLLSVSDDKTLQWGFTPRGKCVKKLEDIHTHFVSCLGWAPGIEKDVLAATNGEKGSNETSTPRKTPTNDVQVRCVLQWEVRI